MPAQRPINASLSQGGLALTVEPSFGALSLREARVVLTLLALAPFAVLTVVIAPSLPVAHPALVGVAVGGAAGLAWLMAAPALRLWPGRSILRRARERFARDLAHDEPPAILLARAVDLAFASGLARTSGFAFDAGAWREACARARLAPPCAVFLAPDLAPRPDSLADPLSAESEDLTANLDPSAGQPGCLLWLVALASCVLVLSVLAGAGGTHLLAAISVGALPALYVLARAALRPVGFTSALAAPGRLVWTRSGAEIDAPREALTFIVARSFGGIVATAWPREGRPLALHFRAPGDEEYARLLQLLLVNGPAPAGLLPERASEDS